MSNTKNRRHFVIKSTLIFLGAASRSRILKKGEKRIEHARRIMEYN
jgi:hypothetical protein